MRLFRHKSVVLSLAIILFLIASVLILSMLYIHNRKASLVRLYEERIKAYYLCESGLSRALLRIMPTSYLAKERVNFEDLVGKQFAFTLSSGSKDYDIHYTYSGSISDVHIKSWVKMPSGYTYYLEAVGVRRQWPFFIKGALPPIMSN